MCEHWEVFMTQIGMRELKENMGLFVSLIKKGGKITLNYRGKPLALVSSLEKQKSPLGREEIIIASLEKTGLLQGGTGYLKKKSEPLKVDGETISDLVIQLRE